MNSINAEFKTVAGYFTAPAIPFGPFQRFCQFFLKTAHRIEQGINYNLVGR